MKRNSSLLPSPPHRQPMEDPLSLISRATTKLFSLWIKATYPFGAAGDDLAVHPTCLLSRRIAPRIHLGNSVVIRKDAWLNVLPEATGEINIKIGDNCLVGAQNVISAKNLIEIEHDVIIGTSVLIQDHNHAYEDVSRPIRTQGPMIGGKIRIGQGSWIGHGVSIVCNQEELVIGPNSVIAANALVTRSFPPFSVIVGNPARLTRQYDPSKGIWVGASARPVAVSDVVCTGEIR